MTGTFSAVPIVFLLYFLVKLKLAKEPFTPGHIIFDTLLFGTYTWCFFETADHFALNFNIPLFYQAVLQLSPVKAGSLLIPGTASTILGAFFGVVYIKKMGKYYYMFVISNAVLILAILPIIVLASPTMSFAQVVSGISVCLFAIGFVHGIMIASFLMALGEHVPTTVKIEFSLADLSHKRKPTSHPRIEQLPPRAALHSAPSVQLLGFSSWSHY